LGEIRSGLRGWMRLPWLYRLFQRLVGGDNLRRILSRDYIQAEPGQRLLDLGCGPGDLVPYLPQTDYYGLDANGAYLQDARSRFGLAAECCFQQELGPGSQLPEGPFHRIVALGLLHHLDDASVEWLLAQASSRLAQGGHWTSIDPCYHRGQSWWSRWWVSRDRGQHVRPLEVYAQMARQHFGQVECYLRQGLIHLPYSHCILVCRERRA
jgi:SAM-dependent methyltransferase